ncbi:MAG: DMT family transporter, partial [Planctomycetota bacterium]
VVSIWGYTFVMVKDSVEEYPVFAFLALRFSMATLFFLPLLALRLKRRPQGQGPEAAGEARERGSAGAGRGPVAAAERARVRRGIVMGGILAGIALGAGYGFQTAGLVDTTPARAGFITGLSVVFVPLGAVLLLKQRAGLSEWLGVLLATAGLVIMIIDEQGTVGRGDLLVLGCAFCYAIQILVIGRYAPSIPPVPLAAAQVLVVAILTGGISLAIDVPAGLPPLRGQVLYAAAFTGALATTFAFAMQTWAQRFTSATHTALIFSLEPVAAAAASYLLTGEVLGGRALWGAGMILAGMLTAELGGNLAGAPSGVRRRRAPLDEAAG